MTSKNKGAKSEKQKKKTKKKISKTIIWERKRFDEAFYSNPVCNQRLLSDYVEVERF